MFYFNINNIGQEQNCIIIIIQFNSVNLVFLIRWTNTRDEDYVENKYLITQKKRNGRIWC